MNITQLTIEQINNLPADSEIFEELTNFGLLEEDVWRKLVVITIRDHIFACRPGNKSQVRYCCYDCSYYNSNDVLLKTFCGSKPIMPIEFYMITSLLNMFHKGEHSELKNLQLFNPGSLLTIRDIPIRFCYTFSYTKHIYDMNKV